MARITVLCVLLVVALVQQQTLATRQVIDVGGEFRLGCPISRPGGEPGRYIIQFFIEKAEVKMFNRKTITASLRLVSNDTTIVPDIVRETNRYMVEEYSTGQYRLIIKRVTESDSAWYGCRRFDSKGKSIALSSSTTELLVSGPFGGVFWTTEYSGQLLDVARQHEIIDGGTLLLDNAQDHPACVVLVSNVEPVVTITIGRFGEPGSVDITDQFEISRLSSTTSTNRGIVSWSNSFFTKRRQYMKTSTPDYVYCRASVFSTTYEKSVYIIVHSKPQNKACEPSDVYSFVGNKNVKLTCLFEAHPEPSIKWILPSGMRINALFNDPNYKVTNQARLQGLLTTLTIGEVGLTEGSSVFGPIVIQATNKEGSGEHYLIFREQLVQQQTLATRQVIHAGGEFRLDCSISMFGDSGRYIIQFFTDKFELKIYNSRLYSDLFKLVSNGTTIVPYSIFIRSQSRTATYYYPDTYMVEEYSTGQYRLIIKNVTESDSVWYGCRKFDLGENRTTSLMGSKELFVPGPLIGIFWTINSGHESLMSRQHEIPDGGTVLTKNTHPETDIACVVLVSNIEPAVNITIGRFGQPGSVDITDQFKNQTPYIRAYMNNGGIVHRQIVAFVKLTEYTKTSLRDVYCRASVFGTTYEKSVNIQVTSKPQNKAFVPKYVAALMGSKNVKLTCLIEAHPEPYIEWILPSGMKINALSNNPNYTVTNEARFEGLFTTLTIAEVDLTEGRIAINATNTEGSGEHYLFFKEGSFGGIFWTADTGRLSLDVAQQHEIADGGIGLTNNASIHPNIACVVLVSNVEPAVTITIGRFGEPGSVDITYQFQIQSSSVDTINDGGTVYRKTLFLTRKWQYTQTSLRDVYCRASLFGTTYEKSVNIQVPSKPKNIACEPQDVYALVGSKNVKLTCLIEAHPEPYVEWTLPSGVQINAFSNNRNYIVTNEARFEGLFTTLTISEVAEGMYDYGRFEINVTNSEGSGEHYLYFKEGDPRGAAGIRRSSATLITITMALLVWMLK